MVPVFPVVAEVGGRFVFIDRLQEDGLRRLADGNDGDRFQRQRQGLADCLFPEVQDEDASVPLLDRLQQHALGSDSQVHVHDLVLRNGTAYDDKCAGLGPRLGQVLLGEGGAQGDVRQDLVRIGLRDQAEAPRLSVHAGGAQGGRPDQLAEFFLRHFPSGIIAAVAAISVQERVQGGAVPADDRLPGLRDFFLAVFEVIVGHGLFFLYCKVKVFRENR